MAKPAKLLNILSEWVNWLQCVYKAALHFANTKSHNIISHACPVKTHPDATMAKDSLHWGGGCSSSISQNDIETWTAHCRGCSWQWHLETKTPIRDMTAPYNAQVPYTAGLETFKTDPSRPRPRPRPHKIGFECSRDQDRSLEDYFPVLHIVYLDVKLSYMGVKN